MTPDDVGPNAYETNEELTPCLFSVGAENLLEKSAIKIYPNPTASHLTIENHNAIANTFTKISLWSIDGRLLLEERINGADAALNLDVSRISNGIYFLQLSGNQKLISEKVIIQK
ncbi:MAG: T9SS type A sorting domain-containing protein [Saprospiraceae bacterium]